MAFYAFGLNYEQAPVHVTEAFSLDEVDQRELYATLDLSDDAEVIFLSTCNRTEVYLYGNQQDVAEIRSALSEKAGRPFPDADAFWFEDEEAILHVLEVASGIRSMVPGDGQILSQIKDAYRLAVDGDAVDSLLHRLMHTAFRAAKRVATETDLSSGAASVSTASVAMARGYFGSGQSDFSDLNILLVGAGKMGRLALGALDTSKPSSVTVTNRSPERAERVAVEHGAQTGAWERRHELVKSADFVIVATGAPEPVITSTDLAMQNGGTSTLLVDISMPRNIDPGVSQLDGYTVFDLDDLQAYVEETEARRGAEIPRAREICADLMSDFVTWVFHQQALQPAIQAIRNTFDAIREQEVDRHAHRTGMNREEVDRLTNSIMQKLLAVPIVKLKNVDPDSIDFVRGIKLLHALFSRPSCEDESAQKAREKNRDYETPSLSDSAGACPFDTHSTSGTDDVDELLRRAVMLTSEEESASEDA
ncbi:glutamyl-tRNA reductase [Longibacter salinarum]|uniref:Glutamyl-tRNA reductase n=1 Tax=Longibacter salinarum TaxID=1850348 RepID=A0A2A8D3J5_9BACT|nr:glutamyl-tRNA reductase [Longibacter salinarum]PEN15208.1 glutamyl-tRNA reductase [Longibacter salinarum]